MFFFFHSFKSGPVAMRRGKPRPFPSSSSSTIQLFPGWWAVVLSSVELSIRINQKSTISQDTKVAVSSSSSSESSSPSDEKVGHLFHLLKHQTFTTLLVSIRFNDVSMVFSAFSAHQVFFWTKSGGPSISSQLWCLHPALWDGCHPASRTDFYPIFLLIVITSAFLSQSLVLKRENMMVVFSSKGDNWSGMDVWPSH